jgi:hypothetical protein
MPFGLRNAPATFVLSGEMEKLPRLFGRMIDIVVSAAVTWKEHYDMSDLRCVLSRLRDNKLQLKLEK